MKILFIKDIAVALQNCQSVSGGLLQSGVMNLISYISDWEVLYLEAEYTWHDEFGQRWPIVIGMFLVFVILKA